MSLCAVAALGFGLTSCGSGNGNGDGADTEQALPEIYRNAQVTDTVQHDLILPDVQDTAL